MAYEIHLDDHAFSGGYAASNINPRTPVRLAGTNSLLVIPCASNNEVVDGVTGAATHLQGEQTVVYFDGNVVKCVAGAATAFNPGNLLSVGSTNGVVIPQAITASGHQVIGTCLTQAAAAGEIVSVFVKPRKA